jgi:hypothetical protein
MESKEKIDHPGRFEFSPEHRLEPTSESIEQIRQRIRTFGKRFCDLMALGKSKQKDSTLPIISKEEAFWNEG